MTGRARRRVTVLKKEAPVTGLVWLNIPLIVLAFAAIVGISVVADILPARDAP